MKSIEKLIGILGASMLGGPLYVFITGASGAGKTTLLKELEKVFQSKLVSFNYFDTIGVPLVEEMIENFGGPEKWQEVATKQWITKLSEIDDKKLIFLEGQFNPDFVYKYIDGSGIENFVVLCIHVDRDERDRRLIHERRQPKLANDDMHNWAEVLRVKTQEGGGEILHSTEASVDELVEEVVEILLKKLNVT